MDDVTAFGLILAIIGCSIAVLALLFSISGKLSRIRENTAKIDDVKTEVTKLATGVDVVIRYGLRDSHGTATVNLPQLGEVQITAHPGANNTEYAIRFGRTHVILDAEYISKKSKELGFEKEELSLLGAVPKYTSVAFNRLVVQVPSTDPEKCSTYISMLLRFIDSLVSRYKEELKHFENIKI